MHLSTLDRLACPSCQRAYELVAHDQEAERIINGYLQCSGCALIIPIVEGFTFFTEPRLHKEQASPAALADMRLTLFGTDSEFERYQQQKNTRNTLEAYAAFQPFNESTRAFTPLIPHITPHLEEGDLILDTWGRTGWSGEWLAGLFPTNRVLSIWEGNSSVLAYRGFRHLLSWQERAENLDIIFTHPEKPLPIQSQSVGMVYGLDSLHRYSFYPFASEALRVTKPSGSCVFPHIHLTNSEPSPFFERGCNQYHGRDYRYWLDTLRANTGRRGWVMSEEALFENGETTELEDQSDTHHYNGLILILPDEDNQTSHPVATLTPPPPQRVRYLVNPFLRFSPIRSTVSCSQRLHGGEAGHLLMRHPVYHQRLPTTPLNLDTLDWLAVIHALQGTTAETLGEKDPGLLHAASRLSRNEILLPVAVSQAALQLQRFHSNQLPPSRVSVSAFWASLSSSTVNLEIPELGVLSGEELCQLASGIAALLKEEGLKPGGQLSLKEKSGPLMVLVGLIAASFGATTCFVDDQGVHANQLTDQGYVLDTPSSNATADSLLSKLESLPQPWPEWQDYANGSIVFGNHSCAAGCSLEHLFNTCIALQHQIEVPDWAHTEGSPLQQLILFAARVLTPPLAA